MRRRLKFTCSLTVSVQINISSYQSTNPPTDAKTGFVWSSYNTRNFLSSAGRHWPSTDIINQTQRQYFTRVSKHQNRELKIRHPAEYCWWKSRCLDSQRNTVSSVWYNFSIKKEAKENTEKKNHQNLCSLRLGVQISFTVVIFFVLNWWIINEFEMISQAETAIEVGENRNNNVRK